LSGTWKFLTRRYFDPAKPSDRATTDQAGGGHQPNAVQQQIAGSLIGWCLGDAPGFVVEGSSREGCLAYVDDFLMTDLAGSTGPPGLPLGDVASIGGKRARQHLSRAMVVRAAPINQPPRSPWRHVAAHTVGPAN
jgi:hypothetical protein